MTAWTATSRRRTISAPPSAATPTASPRGSFTLDGKAYQLAVNDGPNALHGGLKGFDKRLWTIAKVSSEPGQRQRDVHHTSPDGEEGYPGTMQVSATFTLTESNELQVDYRATTDKPTIANITNHSYFNLAGQGSGTFGDRAGADDPGGQLHAGRHDADPDRRNPAGGGDAVRFPQAAPRRRPGSRRARRAASDRPRLRSQLGRHPRADARASPDGARCRIPAAAG